MTSEKENSILSKSRKAALALLKPLYGKIFALRNEFINYDKVSNRNRIKR